MASSWKKTLVQALSDTAQAGMRAVASGAQVGVPTGKRRSSKATCTPCAARAALMKAKESVRRGVL
jgi:hypothetical protein